MNTTMRKMKWMLPVVLLIGFIMRSPITTLPLMLKELATNLHVAQSQLGILTTLPLIMFLLFSNFASGLLNLLGFKKAMMVAIGTLVVGSFLRLIIAMPTMLLGTCLIGAGIAHLNVFMPSLVTAYFPNRIGLYTTLYSFAMIFGNAIFNLITAPVIQMWGWKSMMWLLVIVPVLALTGWLLVTTWLPEKISRTDIKRHVKSDLHVWNNKRAWPFLLTFGGQATLSYTFSAWMPALMDYHRVPAGIIGVITASFALIGLPISIFLPQLLVVFKRRGKKILIWSAGLCGMAAAGMLFVQNTSSVTFWMPESLLIGYAIGVFFIFDMTMFAVKTDNPYATAKLSGMAQAGGYLMSAFGPSLYGVAFAANPTGNLQNSVYMVLVLLALVSSLVIVQIEKV
ncbi:MFS transporter [Paucilactobacillus kaifaensis]|uniref:MFS transporter n=1 Tax=Paucilactobacillus kaifaensis TaxID=2559921 RepID=UPI0010F8D564|nr:MFS transporter [Paucilactobacillus kaifaensis]